MSRNVREKLTRFCWIIMRLEASLAVANPTDSTNILKCRVNRVMTPIVEIHEDKTDVMSM